MQQYSVSLDKLPKKGYYVSKKEQKEKHYHEESHIHKQGPLTGIKTSAHKLYNDVFTYFPKGFKGSKNSDFYEYLSLGMVPYLIGSAMLIASYCAANGKFTNMDAGYARKVAKSFGAGVVLYGLGKVFSRTLSRTLINASTNVNLNLKYLNKAHEVPEVGQEQGIVRTQYPGVYDSSEFPRTDLLSKDSELNHNDRNYHSDRIAKKLGNGEKLNSPEQLTDKKAREVKVRATALENVLGYIPAALGVAIGAQDGFANLKYNKVINLKGVKKFNIGNIRGNIEGLFDAFKESCKQLWQGNPRNFVTKNFGKAMIIGGIAATVLNWLIPVIGFKTNPNTMKSKIDTKKEYEVC